MKKETKQKMRTTSVTITNRKEPLSMNLIIQFDDIPNLITKIDKAIENTDWRKVYVTVDTMDFTNEEVEELNDNDIF